MVKITVDESDKYEEVEIHIKCKQVDGYLAQVIAMIKGQEEKIIGYYQGITQLIEPVEVYYFESVDKKTFAYTKQEVYEVSLRLYELEERYKVQGFFRASKSSIINTNKIKQIIPRINGRIEVVVENGEKLIVSRQYVKNLKEILGL